MTPAPDHAQAWLDEAVDSTRARRFGEAGQRFLRALEIIEAVPAGAERSRKLGLAAYLCSRAGHPDLALMVLQIALEPGE